MTVHDMLEAWSHRRLTTAQALELTGCAIEAELRQACLSSDVIPRSVLYPCEDGPGAGRFVDVTVRVMVSPRRSTVLVERQGEPASLYETREHGREIDGLGAAVEAAVREGLVALKD
ncbi:hypothetical protein [Methylobacterium sp. SD21]|uniref:hypothetical protein n=1 Tax=Methylobacterium litchii TaxID=3138810 RepID=UPI00313B7DA7